jgi:biotin synthase
MWGKMNKLLEELFNTETDLLFSKAQEIGRNKKTIYCSPNILTGDCETKPICRHCKWEKIKIRDLKFNKKRTLYEVVMRTKVLVDAGIDRMFVASGWMGYTVPNYFYEYVSAIKENSSIEIFGL